MNWMVNVTSIDRRIFLHRGRSSARALACVVMCGSLLVGADRAGAAEQTVARASDAIGEGVAMPSDAVDDAVTDGSQIAAASAGTNAGGDAAAMAAENSALRDFIASLWGEAEDKGVSRATFDAATRDLTVDERIVELLGEQPEHARTVADYLSFAVSDKRIADGKAKLAEQRDVLDALETLHGVDRHVVVAIWGLETTYGQNLGSRNVINSLATLAFKGGRRADFGRAQLVAALQILETGDTTPEGIVGSWAGAMGHTQFIPTTFNAFAVDFDGDGKRDVWNSVGDALGSTANYLKESGWEAGARWGDEVVLPADFDFALSGRRQSQTVAAWEKLGVKRVDGEQFDDPEREGGVILPAGARGPAFLVYKNFDAILRYNQAISYALAIGHLSDRLRGGAEFVASWPVDDQPLLRAEREELQTLLVARGLSTAGIDGIIGPASREALRTFQAQAGVPADGHANAALLALLRSAPLPVASEDKPAREKKRKRRNRGSH